MPFFWDFPALPLCFFSCKWTQDSFSILSLPRLFVLLFVVYIHAMYISTSRHLFPFLEAFYIILLHFLYCCTKKTVIFSIWNNWTHYSGMIFSEIVSLSYAYAQSNVLKALFVFPALMSRSLSTFVDHNLRAFPPYLLVTAAFSPPQISRLPRSFILPRPSRCLVTCGSLSTRSGRSICGFGTSLATYRETDPPG